MPGPLPFRSVDQKPGYTVSEVCDAVTRTITDAFPNEVWVRGVLSGVKRSANGHVYFDLIDPADLGRSPEAVLPVALFAASRHRVNAILRKTNAARMEDGTEVRIRGEVAYYPKQGRVQLIMSLIDPAYTLGQLEEAKARLLAELKAEGLLDANKQLGFPLLPLRVGLVTSGGSAAEADFLDELRQVDYPFEITLFDTRVQGAEAAAEVAAAIESAGSETDLDVVALVRGGGARTDLATFDHEDVARAIARCPHPVIVGVGHEIDTSVADQVACRSAKTPTAVAVALVEAVTGFERRVDLAATRLGRLSAEALARQTGRLDLAINRLGNAGRRATEQAGHKLDNLTVRIDALDPQRALARGWSITHTADGQLVTSATAVPSGTELITTVNDGTLTSVTTEASQSDEA